MAPYATAVCQTSDSQYAEENGSSYCGRWWPHTLLTVIVLSLLSFCLFICHYVISFVIYRFLSLHMFTRINKLIAEDSYCSYRFSVHFLLDCLCYSASCTKSGNFWTLRLGTFENNHNTPGLSISFQFCRKLTKHLLYHIAKFDCVMWDVICIFMKSTSCKLTGHKKFTFGVAKVVLVSTLLFKDYMVIFTHFCQTCYQVYTHRIDNFSGSHSMSNTMKNKFRKFLQELFSRGVVWRMKIQFS